MTLWFLGIWSRLERRLGFEPRDRRVLLLMGALVATLFGSYTIAKVLRDSMFLTEFGAAALPYGYITVAFAAAFFVSLEGLMARRSSRAGGMRFTQWLAIGLSALAATLLPHAGRWTIFGFYVWTGSQAMMLLPHFWALALDAWDSRRARTVFPLFAGCGMLGGLAGGALAAGTTTVLGTASLMWALTGLLVAAHVLTQLVQTCCEQRTPQPKPTTTPSRWRIFLRSSYLKLLASGLALSVIVSTLIDFQFNAYIVQLYPEQHTLRRFLGAYYMGLNTLSLLVQFSVTGWLLHRLGLGPTTALQPVSGIAFVTWTLLAPPIGWAILLVRWVQAVVFQSFGKSSTEIYYTAVHPRERRIIKPAIDTLADRWSEALVGVLLLGVIYTVGPGSPVVPLITAGLAVLWLGTIYVLDRQFGRSFERILSQRWIEPEEVPDAIRTPSARRVLLQALRDDDEQRIVFALLMSQSARDAGIAREVRAALGHPSPVVRAAAVDAMRAMRLRDPDGIVPTLLDDPHEDLRRAVVMYLVARGPDRASFARRLLDGDDPQLRQYVVDALFERPYDAPGAITPEWVAQRAHAGSREDTLLAARAAGAMTDGEAVELLCELLGHSDAEVRLAALLSAKRRPHLRLLDVLLPMFDEPELARDASEASAAIGDPAVSRLVPLLEGERGERAQAFAARTLGRIATPRALSALRRLIRRPDPRQRFLGLQGLSRGRARIGRPVVGRRSAHALFLREIEEYRASRAPAIRLGTHPAHEVQLLAASFRESAEMALERAQLALACWYEPRPLVRAFEAIAKPGWDASAPALEYLGHILPRSVFSTVSHVFEREPLEVEAERDNHASGNGGPEDPVSDSVRFAWEWGDPWLRACAVRASRCAAGIDRTLFDEGADVDPLIAAELERLAETGGGGAPIGAGGYAGRGEVRC